MILYTQDTAALNFTAAQLEVAENKTGTTTIVEKPGLYKHMPPGTVPGELRRAQTGRRVLTCPLAACAQGRARPPLAGQTGAGRHVRTDSEAPLEGALGPNQHSRNGMRQPEPPLGLGPRTEPGPGPAGITPAHARTAGVCRQLVAMAERHAGPALRRTRSRPPPDPDSAEGDPPSAGPEADLGRRDARESPTCLQR